jgi:hypothetical protein
VLGRGPHERTTTERQEHITDTAKRVLGGAEPANALPLEDDHVMSLGDELELQ